MSITMYLLHVMMCLTAHRAKQMTRCFNIPHYVYRVVISGKLFTAFIYIYILITYFMPIQVITCLCHILNKKVNIATSLFYQYEL